MTGHLQHVGFDRWFWALLRRLVVLVAGLGFAGAASAERLHFADLQRSDTVIARFTSWDAAHCVGTFTFVGAFVVDSKEQSGPFRRVDDRFLVILKVDTCDPTFDPQRPVASFFASARFTPLGLFFPANLSVARMYGSVGLTDSVGGGEYIVEVDITWEPTSSLQVSAEPLFEFFGPPVWYAYIGHGNTRYRLATARGSVLLGGVNTAVQSTNDTQLSSQASGSVTIIRP